MTRNKLKITVDKWRTQMG